MIGEDSREVADEDKLDDVRSAKTRTSLNK